MSFPLFLLVTATLFVRPAEIVADLEALPIYNWLILACLACTLPGVFEQLSWPSLVERPISLCVLGMLAAVALSHLSHLNLWSTRECSIEFSKVVILYLLLVANVNSTARLRTFLGWLLACIVVVTALGVLQYHEVIDIPALEVLQQNDIDPETGERYTVPRLRSTGLFNDPNDLSILLVLGIILATWRQFDYWAIWRAPLWLASLGLFGHALFLTRSRGGLLAISVALGTLVHAHFGWRKAALLAATALPALALAGGRQTDIGGAMDGGTGQSRVQLWSEGLGLFRRAPIFGIGQNEFLEEIQHVAHNAFVHSFAELGFFGGAIFLTGWVFPIRQIFRMGRRSVTFTDPRLARLRPYMLAAVAGYATSMLTLSRAYVAPTYAVLGIAAVYLRETVTVPELPGGELNHKLVRFAVVSSVIFIVATYVFIRVFAKFG